MENVREENSSKYLGLKTCFPKSEVRSHLGDQDCTGEEQSGEKVELKTVVHASRTMPEIDDPVQIFDLDEPKHNVLLLSSSPSSSPMFQSDHSGREREIQFLDEVEDNGTGLEEPFEPKCNVAKGWEPDQMSQ